jgi:AcrR family transcriptional regulator
MHSPRAVTVVSDPRSSRNQAMTDASRAVVELFIDSGHTDFTVTELARHAGISERSFYRYFPRKEDVVRPFLTGGFERISALVATRPADEPVRTALVAAWSGSWVATDTDRSRRLFRLLFDDDGLRATWFKVITESEAGWARVIALRLGIDPSSQRAALIGAVVAAARPPVDKVVRRLRGGRRPSAHLRRQPGTPRRRTVRRAFAHHDQESRN